MEETENMVEVRSAYKRYAKNAVILRGLNMTVEKGIVYGFLGPSGCGKTTLLKCMLGRQRLDAGEVIVSVQTKADIGYMPQEAALLEELTINETMSFYGRIFGIKGEDLRTRRQQLLQLLELPFGDRLIKDLSGGQLRRVSFCVALLHDPKLLILDEPTVGLDPLLSHSIWQYLVELSSVLQKTIILTTHYIEEARQANKIGMMRNGILLMEGNTADIMEEHEGDTLEDIFLKLILKQEDIGATETNLEREDYPKPKVKPRRPNFQEKWFTFSHLFCNIVKNLHFLKRSRVSWFLLFFNPILQCILFELTVSEPKGLKLGVVNDELRSGDCSSFSKVTCFPSSCKYTDALKDRTFKLITYKNKYDADRATKKNQVWGYLHINEQFTKSFYDKITIPIFVDDDILEKSEISVHLDMSNQVIRNILRKALIESFATYMDRVQADCKWNVGNVKYPIRFNDPIYGTKDPSFADFAVVGVLILMEFFCPIAYTLATLKDQLEGVQERNLVSGMTYIEIVAGNAIVTLVIYSIQTCGMMAIIYGYYDHEFEGSIILALALIFGVGVTGMCFGYVIAVTCDRDSTAVYLALGSYVAVTNLSVFRPKRIATKN